MIRFAKLLLASTLALTGGIGLANAADPVAFASEAPAATPSLCGNSAVLDRIASRFSYQVRHVPHLAQVAITDFRNVGETRYTPKIAGKKPIDRLYCHARADMNDGKSRDVWYVVEHPMGFAGFGRNVEFCVAGFDRWNVYDGRCRVLRPALW